MRILHSILIALTAIGLNWHLSALQAQSKSKAAARPKVEAIQFFTDWEGNRVLLTVRGKLFRKESTVAVVKPEGREALGMADPAESGDLILDLSPEQIRAMLAGSRVASFVVGVPSTRKGKKETVYSPPLRHEIPAVDLLPAVQCAKTAEGVSLKLQATNLLPGFEVHAVPYNPADDNMTAADVKSKLSLTEFKPGDNGVSDLTIVLANESPKPWLVFVRNPDGSRSRILQVPAPADAPRRAVQFQGPTPAPLDEKVAVPAVEEMFLPEATAKLHEAGMQPLAVDARTRREVVWAGDSQRDQGLWVVRQDIGAGEKVRRGQRIPLMVSRGAGAPEGGTTPEKPKPAVESEPTDPKPGVAPVANGSAQPPKSDKPPPPPVGPQVVENKTEPDQVKIPEVRKLTLGKARGLLAKAGLESEANKIGEPSDMVSIQNPEPGWQSLVKSVNLGLDFKVPNVTRLSLEEARVKLKERTFQAATGAAATDIDIVTNQEPPAGTFTPENSPVRLTLDPRVRVPQMEGIAISQAVKRIEERGLRVTYRSKTVLGDRVYDQDPKPDTIVKPGDLVTLTPGLTVPHLLGLTRAEADNVLRQKGLDAKFGRAREEETQNKALSGQFRVESQSQAAGRLVPRSVAINLQMVHYKYVESVTVPDIVGLTLDQARREVEGRSLRFRHTNDPNLGAVAQKIEKQNPAAGAKVSRGATVIGSFPKK